MQTCHNKKKAYSVFVFLMLMLTSFFLSNSQPTYAEGYKGYGSSRALSSDEYYFSDGTMHKINKSIVEKSMVISGRAYDYGCTDGWYDAYFRGTSSDVNDRPMAMVYKGYTFTFSPSDYIVFSPKKPTGNGNVGNRVRADAEIADNVVTYVGQYTKVGDTGSFADLSFEYRSKYVKENLVLYDKDFLIKRFESQCRPEDYDTVNLVFSEIIRVYHSDDSDGTTSAIVYGKDRKNFKDYGKYRDNEIITNSTVFFTDENNNKIYIIKELYAYDSNNNSILLDKKLSMTRFGNLEISVFVPYWWLTKVAVFPVYIDPTVYGDIYDSVIDEFEFDAQEGRNTGLNGACRVNDTNYFLLAFSGDTGTDKDGFLRTLKVYDNGTIEKSVIDSWEYDTSDGWSANVKHLPNTDKYVVAYEDVADAKLKVFTVQVYDDGTINKAFIDIENLTYGGTGASGCFLNQFNDDIWLIAYLNDSLYTTIETVNITTSGDISLVDIQSVATVGSVFPYVCNIDDDTIAVTYDGGTPFTVITYNVTSSGQISDTEADSWDYSAPSSSYATLSKIGDEKYALTYVQGTNTYCKTFNIFDDGMMDKVFIDTLTVTSDVTSRYIETFFVHDPKISSSGKGIMGMTRKGIGQDGFVYTWNITDEGYLDDDIISSFEFGEGDSLVFAHVEYIAENYYLIVYTDVNADGWAKTIYINTNWASPVATNPYPSNGDTGVELQPYCEITVSDGNGNAMNVTFAENSTGSWVNRQTNISVSNGTYRWSFTQAVTNNQLYYWRVYVDDEIHNVSYIYHFTTLGGAGVNPPVGFTATAYNYTVINLTWSIGNNSDYTHIRWSTTGYPSSVTNGNFCCNVTGTSFSHTGLSMGVRYNYSAWGFNSTSGTFSVAYVTSHATTFSVAYGDFFIFMSEIPPDGSTNVSILPILYLTVKQNDSKAFNLTWYVKPSLYSQVIVATMSNLNNGTYSVNLSSLGVGYEELGFYDWDYDWFVVAKNYSDATLYSSPVYEYKTEAFDYENLGVEIAMNVWMILIWIVIWAILLAVNVKERSTIFGSFAGIWIFLLGLFVIATGIQMETGTISTVINPSQTVNYIQYSNAVLPYSTYSYVWGIIFFVIGIFIVFSNVIARRIRG